MSDVDGHENHVIDGAKVVLKSRKVKCWVIELTLDNTIDKITLLMKKNGYTAVQDFEHYPGYTIKTINRGICERRFFIKMELLFKKLEINLFTV